MKDIRELDIVTTVEINNVGTDKEPRYHALYASQLYGTFFGVFGQFTSEPGTEKDTRKVTGLHLRILNLQGVLNIGFSTIDPICMVDKKDDNVPVIRMGVRGASKIEHKTVDLANSPLVLTKGKRLRILIERMVFPLTGFKPSGPEGTLEEFKMLDEDFGTPSQTEAIFDTEFHSRNGTDHFLQKYRDGRSDVPDGAYPWPGIRCVPANIYLLYTGSE